MDHGAAGAASPLDLSASLGSKTSHFRHKTEFKPPKLHPKNPRTVLNHVLYEQLKSTSLILR
jgi:hypothetical protein